jgi:hypothetical protein
LQRPEEFQLWHLAFENLNRLSSELVENEVPFRFEVVDFFLSLLHELSNAEVQSRVEIVLSL